MAEQNPVRDTLRQRTSFRIILASLAALTAAFIIFGVFYERAPVRPAEYKAEVIDSTSANTWNIRDVNARLFTLKTGKYLLVLDEVGGHRTEGYYIDMSAKKLGYAKFSADSLAPITNTLAMVDRAVFTGYRLAEELDADFQILPDGAVITLKGPSELAVALNSDALRLYKNRLIYNKTILFGH